MEGSCPVWRRRLEAHQEASGKELFDQSDASEPPGEEGLRLEGGEYTLTVYGNEGATGAYRFALRGR